MLRIYAQFYFFLTRCNVAQNPSDSTSVYSFLFFLYTALARSFFAFPRNWKGKRLLLNFIVQPRVE